MRTLLLLRHAKSESNGAGVDDHARPLNRRGQHAARRIGELLGEQQLLPERVLCSSAVRAEETARRVLDASGCKAPLDVRRELYLSSPSEYVKALQSLPDEVERVLMVGHNPTLEQLLEQLTGTREHLPTAALAAVELSIQHWREFDFATACELRQLWRVKDLD